MKTKISIEEIEAHLAALRDFNGLDLAEVEFYEDDRKVDIPPGVLSRFRFMGLANKDFVAMRLWEDGKLVEAPR